MTSAVEPQTTAPPIADSANARRLVDLVFRLREFGIVAVLALLVLVTAVIEPRFLNLSNIQFILIDATIFALLALGETMVVLTRNVDLSIGSVLGLSAFLSADLFGHHHGISIPLVFVVGCLIGVACGLVNGFLTVVGLGAAFGALLLNTILSALYVLGVSPFWNQAIAGALLLGAIALDRGISLQLAAALRKRRTHLGA
jgi:ribose/xylose/arabinose/galactoside ABC-type transport system permease subunit